MQLQDKYLAIVRNFLPSPFTIAWFLTFFVFCIALIVNQQESQTAFSNLTDVFGYWYDGLWTPSLLAFTVQMMLILVLGHVLALSKPASWLIEKALFFVRDNASAAAMVAFVSIVVAFFNWGLGLILGAILARKVGEYAQNNQIAINYPLIGAAAYTGLMVWHGGISGSAPLTVATPDHSFVAEMGVIPSSLTLFSTMNLLVSLSILIAIPSLLYALGKQASVSIPDSLITKESVAASSQIENFGFAEKLDRSAVFGTALGFGMLIWCVWMVIQSGGILNFLNLNSINFTLLALALMAHRSIFVFLKQVQQAIGDVSGILIQFPLYFGIMSIMKEAGLVQMMSDFFVDIATQQTLPIFTCLSAGIVNIFIPSGGGQWQVQGPIMIEAANALHVPMEKIVMALAYGDQLTNMMQPFWALPLLGITSLKAKDILPYTLIIMLFGVLIYLTGLLIF